MPGIGVGGALALAGTAASVAGPLLSDTDAGSSAAGLAVQGQQRGREEIRQQFGQTEERFDPFVQAGQQGLEGQLQGSSIGGLDQRLDEIFRSPNFRQLVEERGRAVGLRNAASGNFGSGAGLLDAARVPTELGFDIENMLSGRQTGLAQQGLNASGNLSQFGQRAAQDIAGIEGSIGQFQSQGSLTDAQARADRNSALFSAGTQGLGTIAGFF